MKNIVNFKILTYGHYSVLWNESKRHIKTFNISSNLKKYFIMVSDVSKTKMSTKIQKLYKTFNTNMNTLLNLKSSYNRLADIFTKEKLLPDDLNDTLSIIIYVIMLFFSLKK